jgi:hypothetical protein
MTELEQNQLLKAFEADIKAVFESKKGVVDFCAIWKIIKPLLKKIVDNPGTPDWIKAVLNQVIDIVSVFCPA